MVVISVCLVLAGWGFLKVYPMKSLLMLEFLYLIIVFLLVESGKMGSWVLMVILFSACEGVFLLTVYMVMRDTSSSLKFYSW